MLHIEREILELADQAGSDGPALPAPPSISDAVDRLLMKGLLAVADAAARRISITEEGRAALAS